MAELVSRLGAPHVGPESGLSLVGAVVGATTPDAAALLRSQMPATPFLVPGYGAQGATARDVVPNFRADGSGAVVNASRSVIHPPASGGPWQDDIAAAAEAAKEDLRGALDVPAA